MSSEGLLDFICLANSLGGRHYSFSKTKTFSSVSIDSRSVEQGALFVALSGEKTDGHCYVEDAFKAGAAAAIVESSKLATHKLLEIAETSQKELIAVENTLRALQDTAKIYLDKFPKLVKVGITGSSGKTTTKEIAASIIGIEKNIVINKGNLNSETGLPLSVFAVREDHEVGIFELGMNRKGEIAELARVLTPNIALITNIGSAHIGILGSIKAIVEEKKNIFSLLKKSDIALIPGEDEYCNSLSEGLRCVIRFYSPDTFSELEEVRDLGLDGTEILWAGEKIHFALPGKHNLADALAAIAIAKELNVSNYAIKKGLEKAAPLFGRQEILKGRTTVIRDCYNANPQSMQKSLEFCDSLQWNNKRIYVIADMLELGTVSQAAHEQLGLLLSESKADMIFLFGKEIEAAAAVLNSKCKSFYYTNSIDELYALLDSSVQNNDLVLLKGSRGCALERLSEMLLGDSFREPHHVS